MGILINTGFDVGSSSPIDNRTLKDTIDERDALVSEGKVYENLKVYCKDTQTEYRWTGTEWEEVGSSGGGTAIDDTQASDTTTYSSNKITDLITEATGGKQMITIDNSGKKAIKYFKIANTPVDSSGYMVSMVGLRINTTASNEIFSLNKYNGGYKYTYDRILKPMYSSSDSTVTPPESCYLALGKEYALYAVIGSCCLATIELIGRSNTLIKEEVNSLPTAEFTSYGQTSVT